LRELQHRRAVCVRVGREPAGCIKTEAQTPTNEALQSFADWIRERVEAAVNQGWTSRDTATGDGS
jgi:hypothetical protein